MKQQPKLSNKKLTEAVAHLQVSHKALLDFFRVYIDYKGDKDGFTKHVESLKTNEQ